jgi:hypothetical protein
VVLLHANPALQGQQIPGWFSVQFWTMYSPGGQDEMQISSAAVVSMFAVHCYSVYLRRTPRSRSRRP